MANANTTSQTTTTTTHVTNSASSEWTSSAPTWSRPAGQSHSTGSQSASNILTGPETSATQSEGRTEIATPLSPSWTSETPTMLPATSAPIATINPSGKTQEATSPRLDQNAIIAGVVVGVLLIAIVLVTVCLARAKRRRGGVARQTKTPRPTPAGAAAAIAREPNPYTNTCFDASKEEMGERVCQSEEPAIVAPGAVNSIRNKEDNWIIPLEELAEDETTANFDTTRF